MYNIDGRGLMKMASSRAYIVNTLLYHLLKFVDVKIAWHIPEGATIVSPAFCFHADFIKKYGNGRGFNDFIRGIYFKRERQYHTRHWLDTNISNISLEQEAAIKQSERMQRRSYQALIKCGIISADTTHIINSNNEIAMRMVKKKFN